MARRLTPAFVVLLAVACAADEVFIDSAQTNIVVAESVAHVGATDVTCPAPVGTGPQTLTCTGDIAGTTVDILVSLDVDPDITPPIALADVVVDAALLDLRVVEIDAAAAIRADLGGAPLVQCPYLAVVIGVGVEVECEVSDAAAGVREKLTIRLVGMDGAWEIDLFD